MKVLLSGASGFLGTALQPFLKEKGGEISRLVRRREEVGSDAIFWDPLQHYIEQERLEGFDVVINLAGESIAGGRWTAARKQRILESRVKGTQLLSQALSRLESPPNVFLSASAIGYYGDQGNAICNEDQESGSGFLAEVCREWEKATEPARSAHIRTVNMRFGLILSSQGGVLRKMLIPFKLGFGGVLGSGNQWMSWVALEDVLHIILYLINAPQLSGPINVVSPHPVTNRELTKTLGKVLHRPTICSVPAWALRILLGKEMANEMLLSSTRATPKRLLEAGYQFRYPTLEGYLALCNKSFNG